MLYQEELKFILNQSPVITMALTLIPKLNLPNWYLGGGCIAQTVWNHLSGLDLLHGIKDMDIVYFDPNDLSERTERLNESKAEVLLSNLPIKVDLKNEARVHLWYEGKFGKRLEPYTSTEHAISTWPITAASIGVRKTQTGNLLICAPFSMEDLFNMIVRANKTLITRDIYEAKVERWYKEWPNLKIIPWGN